MNKKKSQPTNLLFKKGKKFTVILWNRNAYCLEWYLSFNGKDFIVLFKNLGCLFVFFFPQAWRLLQDKKDLNCILPLKVAKHKR